MALTFYSTNIAKKTNGDKTVETNEISYMMRMISLFVVALGVFLLTQVQAAVISTDRVGHIARCRHPNIRQFVESVLVIGSAGHLGAYFTQYLAACGVKRINGLDNYNAIGTVSMKRRRVREIINGTVPIMQMDVCDMVDFDYQFVVILVHNLYPRDCFDDIVRKLEKQRRVPQLFYLTTDVDDVTVNPVASLTPTDASSPFRTVRLLQLGPLYGPYADSSDEIYTFIDKIIKFEEVALHEEGGIMRRYTYVMDAVQIVASALLLQTGEASVELSAALVVQQKEVVAMLEPLLRREAKLRLVPNTKSRGRDADSTAVASMDRQLRTNNYNDYAAPPQKKSSDQLDIRNRMQTFLFTRINVGLEATVNWYKSYRSALLPCASECHFGHLCFPSVWDAAASTSRRLTAGCRAVVYTIAAGTGVDRLPPIGRYAQPSRSWSPADAWSSVAHVTCNVAFVSKVSGVAKYPQFGNWTLVIVDDATNDAFTNTQKSTRLPMISPGYFFAHEVDYAVYVDSRLQLLCNPMYFVSTMTGEYRLPTNAAQAPQPSQLSPLPPPLLLPLQSVRDSAQRKKIGFLAVRYAARVSVFESMEHSMNSSARAPSALKEQYDAYKAYAAANHWGLRDIPEVAFLIHDLKSKAARSFRCAWYEEYQNWSDQEQLAAAFILATFERTAGMNNNVQNEFVSMGRDFPRKTAQDGVAAAAAAGDIDVVHSEEQPTALYAHLLDSSTYHWQHSSLIAVLSDAPNGL